MVRAGGLRAGPLRRHVALHLICPQNSLRPHALGAIYCAERDMAPTTNTTLVNGPGQVFSGDTFAALEERVVRTIGLLRAEREQRAALEKQLEQAKEEAALYEAEMDGLRRQLKEMEQEREAVRLRVERLLENLDAIGVPQS